MFCVGAHICDTSHCTDLHILVYAYESNQRSQIQIGQGSASYQLRSQYMINYIINNCFIVNNKTIKWWLYILTIINDDYHKICKNSHHKNDSKNQRKVWLAVTETLMLCEQQQRWSFKFKILFHMMTCALIASFDLHSHCDEKKKTKQE